MLYPRPDTDVVKGDMMNEPISCEIKLERTLIQDGPKFLSHKLIVGEQVA